MQKVSQSVVHPRYGSTLEHGRPLGTCLFAGLFTKALEIFWSMKNNTERQNPKPPAENTAGQESLCTGTMSNTALLLYSKWRTAKKDGVITLVKWYPFIPIKHLHPSVQAIWDKLKLMNRRERGKNAKLTYLEYLSSQRKQWMTWREQQLLGHNLPWLPSSWHPEMD